MFGEKKHHEQDNQMRLPKVFITPEAKERLDLYIKCCPDEISGLGRVVRLGNDFLVDQVLLFKQAVTSATTEMDASVVSGFLFDCIRDGVDPSTLKLWWHSHAAMATFWSGTDNATVETFVNGEWMLSIVGNHKGEYRTRLDLFSPIRLTLDNLPLRVHTTENEALRNEIETEIADKVTRSRLFLAQSLDTFAGKPPIKVVSKTVLMGKLK